jgi:glutamate--cysteine ligase
MLEERLARLLNSGQQGLLSGGRVGLEKEALRVTAEGVISRVPHPSGLGSPLTNGYITTDYSEALTELITPPMSPGRQALDFLRDAQQFVTSKLQDEILWATSMPCVLQGGESIPIADYGASNAGLMKTIYRRGLGHRYGRVMQVISGVHFNYSLPESFWPVYQRLEQNGGDSRAFVDAHYFGMIRNLERYGWLAPYLFGASPAVCKSFLEGKPSSLQAFNDTTRYEPFATSLRMGKIGYTNRQEECVGAKACYDNLNAYVTSLTRAIETPCSEWEKIGVEVNGRYEQLNANILQIENEYYSTVRPKQVLEGLEKPTLALRQRGVRYVELRSLDVNVFHPLGVSEGQVLFLEAFMLYCLLQTSPTIRSREQKEIDRNLELVAHQGRDPSLRLFRNGSEIALADWAAEICDDMQGICELLDAEEKGQPYGNALTQQRELVRDPDRTPSARMLAEMRENSEGFFQFAQRMSEQHHSYFQGLELGDERRKLFEEEVVRSREQQKVMEDGDTVSFKAFLADYFAQQ